MTLLKSRASRFEAVTLKRVAVSFIFCWFFVGGIGHFLAADFFLKIIPPSLPFRMEAVYISGFFELVGAVGLLLSRLRKSAGIGLVLLTIAVTPANVYMALNPQLFTAIPELFLILRLVVQAGLLGLIVLATQ